MNVPVTVTASSDRSLLGRIAFALVLYVVFDGFNHGMFDVPLAPGLSLTALALLFAIVIVAAEALIDRRLPVRRPRALTLVLTAFVAYIAFSARYGGGTFDLSFAKNLLLFLLVLALVRSVRDVSWVLGAAAAAGVWQAALGLAQLMRLGDVPVGGLTGALPNHVQYAVYLLLSAIALVTFVATCRGAVRWLLLVPLAAIVAVMLMTLARGVLVTAGLVGIAGIVMAVRDKRRALAWAAALVAAGLALTLVSGRFGTLVEIPSAVSDPERLDVLLSGRLALLTAAWNMFVAHPVLGVGYGRFPQLWTQYVSEDVGNIFLRQFQLATHSTYLQIMAETGIIGIALYVSLVALGLRYAWGAFKAWRDRHAFLSAAALAVLLGVLAIAAHGILDNTGWHDRVFYVFLALSAALASMARVAEAGSGSPAATRQRSDEARDGSA